MKVERGNHVSGKGGLTKKIKIHLRPVNRLLPNCIMYHKKVQGLLHDWYVRGCAIYLCEWTCTAEGGMCSIYFCVYFPAFVFFMCACVHVWVYLSGNETLDRRVIDSENLQINSWTAGAEEIRSEARAAWSAVRQAPEQTVISGL